MENTGTSQNITLVVAIISLIIAIISKLPPINKNNLRVWKRVFWVCSLLFIVSIVACLVFLRPKPSIQITYPEDRAEVLIDEMIKGTSDNLPDDYQIWLVLYSHPVSRYYPQDNPVEMEMTGNWSSRCHIGIQEDKAIMFDIIAVLADKNLQSEFLAYHSQSEKDNIWQGFEKLPENAKIYHRITVIRK